MISQGAQVGVFQGVLYTFIVDLWWFMAGWWFGTFFMFPYIGNSHPIWLIFSRWLKPPTSCWFMMIYGYFWNTFDDGKKPPRIQTKSLVRLFCQIPSDGGVLWRFTNGFFGGSHFWWVEGYHIPMKHDLFCEDPQQSTQSLPMDPVALEGTKGSPVTIPQSEPSEAVRYGWIYRATSPQSWYIMIISLWILDSYQPQRIISIRIFRLLSHRYRLSSWYIMIISF